MLLFNAHIHKMVNKSMFTHRYETNDYYLLVDFIYFIIMLYNIHYYLSTRWSLYIHLTLLN